MNAPGEVRVQATDSATGPIEDGSWWDVVPTIPVLVDTRHHFLVGTRRPATHLRLDVYPDGGLTRLRCLGEIDDAERRRLYARFFDSLPPGHREFGDTVPVSPARTLPPDDV